MFLQKNDNVFGDFLDHLVHYALWFLFVKHIIICKIVTKYLWALRNNLKKNLSRCSCLHLHLYSKTLYTYLCHLSKITFEIYLPPCCPWKNLHIYIPLLLDFKFELNSYYSSFMSFVIMLVFLLLSLCWYTSVGDVFYLLIYVFFFLFSSTF